MNHAKSYLLECCVDSVESAIMAKKGGADRLELCSNLIIGGTTPTLALYEQIRETVDIPIHILIRPRFGDFLYSSHELSIIQKEIDIFRSSGADGIVIGCLREDGNLAVTEMKTLVEHAGDMRLTLHRAFDMCKDPFKTLEEAKALGIHNILTSGQSSSCSKGIDLLGQLSEEAGDDISIIAGAGVNETAIRTLLAVTSISSFHMSGKKIVESRMQFRNSHVSMGIPGMSEYEIWQTDAEEIAAVKHLLNQTQACTSY